ncbi:hypothetical protein D3C75_519710 [compost metagenome]
MIPESVQPILVRNEEVIRTEIGPGQHISHLLGILIGFQCIQQFGKKVKILGSGRPQIGVAEFRHGRNLAFGICQPGDQLGILYGAVEPAFRIAVVVIVEAQNIHIFISRVSLHICGF